MTPDCFSMTNKPRIPPAMLADVEREELNSIEELYGRDNLLDYLYPERIPKEAERLKSDIWKSTQGEIDSAMTYFSLFYTKSDVINYLRQKESLDARQKKYRDCMAVKYPPKPKPPKPPKIYEIPMKQLEKPVPGKSPRKPEDKYIEIDFNLGERIADPNNIMQVTFWITEVPPGAGPGYIPIPKPPTGQ